MTTTPPPGTTAAARVRRAGGVRAGGLRARGLRAGAVGHPLWVVWFATAVFSIGPVLVASASISGAVFSFWRLWFGVVLLAVPALLERRRRGPLRAAGVRITALAGGAFGLHMLTFMMALRATSVVDVTLMNTLAPVVVAMLAVPMFGERPGRQFRAWSALAIVGAALVALAGSTGPQGRPAGIALAAANVVFYSLFFVWSKRGRDLIEPWTFLWGTVTVAAVEVSVFAALSGAPIAEISPHDLALCLAVAALPGLVGHFAMTWSLKYVPANLPPLVLLAMPLFSGALAWVLLGQTVQALSVVGGACTLVGVAGAVRTPGARTLADEALEQANET